MRCATGAGGRDHPRSQSIVVLCGCGRLRHQSCSVDTASASTATAAAKPAVGAVLAAAASVPGTTVEFGRYTCSPKSDTTQHQTAGGLRSASGTKPEHRQETKSKKKKKKKKEVVRRRRVQGGVELGNFGETVQHDVDVAAPSWSR